MNCRCNLYNLYNLIRNIVQSVWNVEQKVGTNLWNILYKVLYKVLIFIVHWFVQSINKIVIKIVQPLSKHFVQYLQTKLYRLYRLYELVRSYNIVRVVQPFVQYCKGLVCRCPCVPTGPPERAAGRRLFSLAPRHWINNRSDVARGLNPLRRSPFSGSSFLRVPFCLKVGLW